MLQSLTDCLAGGLRRRRRRRRMLASAYQSSPSPEEMRVNRRRVKRRLLNKRDKRDDDDDEDDDEEDFCDNSIRTSKYTPLDFIPKSLFEQFRRLGNLYFLILSILMTIGTFAPKTFDSPLTPWSTLLPLMMVLMFTMIKEGLEDAKRHRCDHLVDSRPASALARVSEEENEGKPASTTCFVEIKWSEIQVGNIIRVRGGESIPADVVVIRTSEPENVCYVETSNIDGETNLKMKRGVVGLPPDEEIRTIVCEPPNGKIHSFKGFCTMWSRDENQVLAVDETSFLLRGSKLENATWVEGMVVYTGRDSKLARNASKPRLKLSNVEKTMNRLILTVFLFLFTLVTISTVIKIWYHDNKPMPYLRKSGDSFTFPYFLAYWLTFIILYNNALPMSLYVTVEMVNFGQAYFIDNDVEMYDPETNTPARAVTSNLNSDLGQVEYIFSDKTGTLTKNVMTFRRCSIAGEVIYGGPLGIGKNIPTTTTTTTSGGEYKDLSDLAEKASREEKSKERDFLMCLSVAHTVVVGDEGGNGGYRAESPDEKALCEGARDMGFVFTGRSGPSSCRVRIPRANGRETEEHEQEEFDVLAVNDFTSARKRMSVLVRRRATGELMLMCKGADSAVVPLCREPRPWESALNAHLDAFADEGLRTLVVGMRKEIPASVAEEWVKKHAAARASIEGRDVALEKVAGEMEAELELVGASAIEDQLQDGVPETLEALRGAGIKIWVLTGDKLETAVNIGFSSRLLDPRMRLIRIKAETKEALVSQLKQLLRTLLGEEETEGEGGRREAPGRLLQYWWAETARRRFLKAAAWWRSHPIEGMDPLLGVGGGKKRKTNSSRGLQRDEDESEEDYALAITGKAFEVATEDEETTAMLLRIALTCRVVLACRVSPKQKAQVVRLVKRSRGGGGTMANPLVTLAIGDGANDVSMIQEAQVGVGISGKEGMQAVNASDFAISQFRFLKRLLLVHGRWSYRRMAKVVLYSLYKNLVLVLLLFYFQVFAAFSGQTLFEGMVQAGYNFFLGMSPLCVGLFDREISARFLLRNPPAYVSGRRNLNLNPLKLSWRVVEALVHSLVLFAIPFAMFRDGRGDDEVNDLYSTGLVVYVCLILVMLYKIVFEGGTFTQFDVGALLFSLALFFGFLAVYNVLHKWAAEFYFVAFTVCTRRSTWLLGLICVTTCAVFDITVKLSRLQFIPHPVDILIERDRFGEKYLAEKQRRRERRLRRQRKRMEGNRRSWRWCSWWGNGPTEREETQTMDVSTLSAFSHASGIIVDDDGDDGDVEEEDDDGDEEVEGDDDGAAALTEGNRSSRDRDEEEEEEDRGTLLERVGDFINPSHHEIMQRLESLTAEDFEALGIDTPPPSASGRTRRGGRRSGFDFAEPTRFPSGSSLV